MSCCCAAASTCIGQGVLPSTGGVGVTSDAGSLTSSRLQISSGAGEGGRGRCCCVVEATCVGAGAPHSTDWAGADAPGMLCGCCATSPAVVCAEPVAISIGTPNCCAGCGGKGCLMGAELVAAAEGGGTPGGVAEDEVDGGGGTRFWTRWRYTGSNTSSLLAEVQLTGWGSGL